MWQYNCGALAILSLTWLHVSLFFKAVWAGWGHASENPKLPDLLSKHGITFIGKNFLKIYENLFDVFIIYLFITYLVEF